MSTLKPAFLSVAVALSCFMPTTLGTCFGPAAQ